MITKLFNSFLLVSINNFSLYYFLEKYNFPKLDQEEIENLNRPITSTEIETVTRYLPTNKPQDQPASQLNSMKN